MEILHYVINEKLPKYLWGKLNIKARKDYDMYGIQTSIYRYVIFTAEYCWNSVHLPKIAV